MEITYSRINCRTHRVETINLYQIDMPNGTQIINTDESRPVGCAYDFKDECWASINVDHFPWYRNIQCDTRQDAIKYIMHEELVRVYGR